ncbi:MAG: hypothetical protein OXE56_06005 [Gammaproteobacteria bacterium]|nr:hypothetical protein [Gammaproteobacteria bacterium]
MTYLTHIHGINLRLVLLLCSLGLLSGCQVSSTNPNEDNGSYESEGSEHIDYDNYEYSVQDKLLTDILAGQIANEQGQKNEALDFLTRAAVNSKNKQLIEQAFHLAIETEYYQHAIRIAKLFQEIEPDNHRGGGIMLANPHFRLGNTDDALEIIRQTILAISQDDFFSLRSIATFLSSQPNEKILNDYQEYMGQHSDDARITLVAAQLAYHEENWTQFSDLIDQTLSLDPDWEAPAVLKLSVMVEQSPYSVLTYAREHLTKYPEQKLFRITYADVLINMNFENLALIQAREILKNDPDYLDALIMAGSLQFDNNNSESRTLLSRYIELGGIDPQAIFLLSEIAKKDKDYKEALNQLYSIGTNNQFYLEARLRIGRIYEERDGTEAGIKYLDGISIQGQSELFQIVFEKDRMYQDVGDFEESRALLDDLVQREPDNSRLLYRRGLLFSNMDLLDLHEIDMRKVIELEPENAYAYNALGYVLADKTNRYEEAYDLINRAMELRPNDPYITDSLGWVYYRLGNNELAIQYLTEASELLWDAEIAAHLGEVLWITDQREEANDLWDRALEDFPDHPILNETIKRLREAKVM